MTLWQRRVILFETLTITPSFLLWVGLIGLGFPGASDPMHNLLTLVFRTGVWVALPLASVLCGNLWRALNPRDRAGPADPRRFRNQAASAARPLRPLADGGGNVRICLLHASVDIAREPGTSAVALAVWALSAALTLGAIRLGRGLRAGPVALSFLAIAEDCHAAHHLLAVFLAVRLAGPGVRGLAHLPLSALMAVYAVPGLWLLSSPGGA